MSSRSNFLIFIALSVSGSFIGACGDGEINSTQRSSDDERTPGPLDVDESTPGGSWWDGVAKPNASNTGPNCSAPGCPSATLRNIGSCPKIDETYARGLTDRTLENFECDGQLTIETSNVTLSNFRVDGSGAFRGIFVESGLGISGNLFEYGEIDGKGVTKDCIAGRGFTGRYLHVHHCDDTQKVGGLDQGPLIIEHSYYHDAVGGHGDAFQVWPDMDSAVTVRNSSIECGSTTSCLITTGVVGGVITFENNWIYTNNTGYAFYCGWDLGDVGPPAVYVGNNLFDRNYRFALAKDIDDCVWTGNLWMDDFTPANGDTD